MKKNLKLLGMSILCLLFVSCATKSSNQQTENKDSVQNQTNDNSQNAFDLRIKFLFEGKTEKGSPREVIISEKEPKTSYCYDNEVFYKLMFEGNAQNITIILKGTEDSDIGLMLENVTINGPYDIAKEDLKKTLHDYNLIIKQNGKEVFKGLVYGENCSGN